MLSGWLLMTDDGSQIPYRSRSNMRFGSTNNTLPSAFKPTIGLYATSFTFVDFQFESTSCIFIKKENDDNTFKKIFEIKRLKG